MTKHRLVCIGTMVCLVMALVGSFQSVSARSVHAFTHLRPSVSVTVRISRARAIRRMVRRRSREQITVVVSLRGTGLKPRARLTVENDVVVRVNVRRRTTTDNPDGLLETGMDNPDGALEAERDTKMTAQTDATGALSADIPIDMDGPAEDPGTVDALSDTATVSDSTGQQLASTDTTASVTTA